MRILRRVWERQLVKSQLLRKSRALHIFWEWVFPSILLLQRWSKWTASSTGFPALQSAIEHTLNHFFSNCCPSQGLWPTVVYDELIIERAPHSSRDSILAYSTQNHWIIVVCERREFLCSQLLGGILGSLNIAQRFCSSSTQTAYP